MIGLAKRLTLITCAIGFGIVAVAGIVIGEIERWVDG